MKSNIEEAKKTLKEFKLKVAKFETWSAKLAIALAIISAIFLIAVPFMTINGKSMAMFELFDYTKEELDLTKLFFVANWISTAVVAIIGFLAMKDATADGWVKKHCIAGVVNLVAGFGLLVNHMISEIELSYARSDGCALWRLVPVVICVVYLAMPISSNIYKKAIPQIEAKIAEYEKED